MSIHILSKTLLTIILLAAGLTAGAQTNSRIKQLQKQSTTLKKQIADSEKLLRSTKKDVSSQLNNLAILNGQIDEQQKIVTGYEEEAAGLARDINGLEKQIATLTAELAACKHKYRRAVLYMNRNRLMQNKWGFILMSENFRQMYRRMRYAANYSKYLKVQGEAIRKKETALRAKQQQLATTKRDKDLALADARQQQTALKGQKEQRQTVIDELNKRQKQLNSSIAQQRKKYTTLNANIERLIQQEIAAAEARRKKAEAARRAREKSSASKKTPAKTGKKTPAKPEPRYEKEDNTDRTVSSGFRANRGRLPVPITGSYAVTSRYGQYNVDGLKGVTLDSKGINLTGQPGAKARCVYEGEVSAVANIIHRHRAPRRLLFRLQQPLRRVSAPRTAGKHPADTGQRGARCRRQLHPPLPAAAEKRQHRHTHQSPAMAGAMSRRNRKQGTAQPQRDKVSKTLCLKRLAVCAEVLNFAPAKKHISTIN